MPAQPPAKGGSTSITAPSSSTIDSLAARPTGSAFTRNDDLAMTIASRVSGRRLATAASSASRRVTASTDSSGMPAASFAAAQYLMLTLAMSVILTSTGPRAMLPPGPICVYTDEMDLLILPWSRWSGQREAVRIGKLAGVHAPHKPGGGIT